MQIETGQRTFFIAVSGIVPFTSYVPFFDTSGNPIKCNYISVQVTNGSVAGNGYAAFEVSGVSKVTSINNIQTATARTNVQASGIVGFGIPYGGGRLLGSHEWHGSNGEVAVGLTIKTTTHTVAPNGAIVGITYGNLLPYNSLRANSYDKGR